jgi:hypothetical protein
VFDDGLETTPPEGPFHIWRNDLYEGPTSIELQEDMWGTVMSLRYENLNFDHLEDQDHFRVRLPHRANTECRRCLCGDVWCSEALDINVQSNDRVHIGFYYADGSIPDGSNGILPDWGGWETEYSTPIDREIRIECPYDEEFLNQSIVNDHQEIAFFVAPDLEQPSRDEYNLTVRFHPLPEERCTGRP